MPVTYILNFEVQHWQTYKVRGHWLPRPISPATQCQGSSRDKIKVTDTKQFYWVTAKPEKEGENEFSSPEYSNSSDERLVLIMVQNVAAHVRTNMPKHVTLVIAVRHMTRWKPLINMLRRMGHRDSYDDVEAMDTSLAKEILASGVVIPSSNSPGVSVQVTRHNTDIKEETLRGKSITHATTLVLYQRGQFGPAPKPSVHADLQRGNCHFNPLVYANPSNSTVHTESCYQFIWEDTSRVVQMNWKPAFGSLYDGSCLGIGKNYTNEAVWGGTLYHRKTKSVQLEWLQCCGSVLCSTSHKHQLLPNNRWLWNIVQQCLHSHETRYIWPGYLCEGQIYSVSTT